MSKADVSMEVTMGKMANLARGGQPGQMGVPGATQRAEGAVQSGPPIGYRTGGMTTPVDQPVVMGRETAPMQNASTPSSASLAPNGRVADSSRSVGGVPAFTSTGYGPIASPSAVGTATIVSHGAPPASPTPQPLAGLSVDPRVANGGSSPVRPAAGSAASVLQDPAPYAPSRTINGSPAPFGELPGPSQVARSGA